MTDSVTYCVQKERGVSFQEERNNLERRTRPRVQVKDLTELELKDLWRKVKEDEVDWWGDLK